MKKYILPGVILLFSLYFLNTITEPPKEEQKVSSETKPDLLPSITTNSGSEELILLEEAGVEPRNISTKKLKEAWEQAATITVNPWEQLSITYPIYPERVTYTEYTDEQGIIGYQDEADIYTAPSSPGVRGLIISAEWAQGGKASYFAKIDVQKVYSYQELVTSKPGSLTVIAFSEPGKMPEIPPSEDSVYTVKTVTGNKEDLLKDYPELGLGALPVFFVFDTTQLVYQTLDHKELITFLTKEEEFVYKGESENWKITLNVKQKVGNTTLDSAFTYKGGEGRQAGEYDVVLNGNSWSIGEGSLKPDETNQLFFINSISWPITKEEELKFFIRNDGKEEIVVMKMESN